MLSDLEALGNDPGFAYMPIVYPKASIEQSYSVFVDGSAAVGSIAACTKHFSALSAYLQYSVEIRDYALYQYFESVANCSFSKGQNKDVYESFSMIEDAIASPLNPLLLECLIENGASEEPILPPRELLSEAILNKENTFEQKYKQNHAAYAAAYAAVTRNK